MLTPKEEINRILDEYQEVITELQTRAAAQTKKVKSLEWQADEIRKTARAKYAGMTFKEVAAAEKADGTKDKYEKKLLELSEEAEEEKKLYRAIKAAQDSAGKNVANFIRDEILLDIPKWTKFPPHYKKFKKLFSATFGDRISFHNSEYRFEIYIQELPYPYNSIPVFYGRFEPEELNKYKTTSNYEIIAPRDVEWMTRDAINARSEYIRKYNEMKKELDAIRDKFSSCGALFEIFPCIEYLNEYNHSV